MSVPAAATDRRMIDGARALQLEYPMSVATFDRYADAQRAVDYLADERFAVENLAIVGTDLRQYERVLGRKTWGSVLTQGAMSGVSTGLLVALLLTFLGLAPNVLAALAMGVLMGVALGLVFAALSYALTRGPRDFESITQTYARSYELLAEHKVAQSARELLGRMPGGPVTGAGAVVQSAEPVVAAPAAEAPAQSVAPAEPTFDPRPPQS